MFPPSCSCLCPIHWSHVLSWEWRCGWSSADRRCCNYIWVISNLIAYKGASYIRGFMVALLHEHGWSDLYKRTCYVVFQNNSVIHISAPLYYLIHHSIKLNSTQLQPNITSLVLFPNGVFPAHWTVLNIQRCCCWFGAPRYEHWFRISSISRPIDMYMIFPVAQ